ncbi:MAG: hypothetical protein NXI23_05400 [Bacteroidetes bacterium]|jgi:kelch-like protein 2/3|nr:hypothetical protein [Bacteroidota bacterium]MDF1865198.1 kelch repeat-containing protein [Saprospiraceae bacterium]
MKQSLTTKMLVLIFFMAFVIKKNAQWEYNTPMPTPRGLVTSTILDNKIYVMGGTNTPFGMGLSTVEVYDPATDTWDTNVPNLPVPLLRASSGVINRKIYATGGHHENTGGGALNTVYEYDPNASGGWTLKANLLKPRFYHETEVIDDKMYVMGGRSLDIPGPVDQTVEMYDPDTDTWTFVASMHQVRGGFSSVILDE